MTVDVTKLRLYAKRLASAVIRRAAPVEIGDLRRAQPVSRTFGLDRGTPIDRYYIDRFLTANSTAITGKVMEIGGSYYATKYGHTVETIAVLHATADNPEATIIGDLADRSTLPAAVFDCLLCTQTLNFIFDVHGAVAGIHHVLRPGGVALCTVAGISQISRYDMDRWGDYWRFTDASVRSLFAPLFGSGVRIETFGNVVAALAFLQGMSLEDLPDPTVLDTSDPDYQMLIAVVARRMC